VATYEFWLKTGIVLLGVRFLLGDILKLGGVSLAFVAIELAMSIALMTALGRWFRLSPKLTSLLAIGSSICGVSAIIAAKGAIDADDEDASYAIAAILALGAFSLFAFPAAKFAVLAKTARNATIGFVVLGYAIYWARKSNRQSVENKAAFLWQKFPKFVLGFLLISLLATLGAFTKPQIADLANLSRWAFLLTFAGVGLQTNIRELTKQGLRPLAVGAIGEFAIAGVTLALIFAASRLL
jgi:uncharacterized membrane protein YadS